MTKEYEIKAIPNIKPILGNIQIKIGQTNNSKSLKHLKCEGKEVSNVEYKTYVNYTSYIKWVCTNSHQTHSTPARHNHVTCLWFKSMPRKRRKLQKTQIKKSRELLNNTLCFQAKTLLVNVLIIQPTINKPRSCTFCLTEWWSVYK